jgi:hypothetical protein
MDKLPPKSEAALHREATIARPGRSKPANLRDQVSNMHRWPTPNVCGGVNTGPLIQNGNHYIRKSGKKAHLGLDQAVKMWPTPTHASAHKEVVASQKCNNLVAFAKMFPTPTATDSKGAPSLESVQARAMESKRGVRLPEQLARDGAIGQLNPNWVEWLMGWPIGWTDLKPLETAKFQEWLQQHSLNSQADSSEAA